MSCHSTGSCGSPSQPRSALTGSPVSSVENNIDIRGSVICRTSAKKALLPTPVGVGRFVTRTTRERGVGVRPSRGLLGHLVKQHEFYLRRGRRFIATQDV